MVNAPQTNADVTAISDPEVRLAVAYAPARARAALIALWALDARLAAILRTTTEPMIGQMRLTWWHDAVGRPGAIAGEPILAALAVAGLAPVMSQRIVEGWEALLDDEDDAALGEFAAGRGGGLFAAAATALGIDAPVEDAGAGWALVDLARHHSRAEVAERALRLAADRLARGPVRWSKDARPLAMLAKLAGRDLAGPEPQGSPRRIAAMAALALIGR